MDRLIGIFNIDDNLNKAINFSSFYKFGFNLTSLIIFTLGLSFLISIVTVLSILKLELFILPAVLSIVIIPFFFIYPKFWIYTVTFSTFIFFGENEKGVSVFDVLTGLFYIGGLIIWFFTEIIINRRKIIEDSWEFSFLLFFLLLPLTYLGFFDNDLSFLDWSRGYILYALMLYYFPMKRLLKTKEDWLIFANIFVFVTFLTGLKQIYYYYTNIISDLMYAYQIGTSIRTNQLLYSFVLSFLFLIYFEIKSKWKQFAIFIILSIILLALATSFSRIFWITSAFCLMVSFMNYKLFDKFKFFIIIAATGLIFYVALSLMLKDNLKVGWQFLNKRVTSSSAGTKDVSATARFVEWDKVLIKIKESPIVGQGINKNFIYNSPISDITINHNIIHNGYLHMLYFFGIPLGVSFWLLFLYKLYQSIFLIFNVKDNFFKNILISILYFYFIFIFVSFFTTEFHKRDDVFLIPLVFALIYFVKSNNEKLNLIENNKEIT
jgi:O-antigen ligase